MKIAIIFFILGIGQGFILTDWHREKQANQNVSLKKKAKLE